MFTWAFGPDLFMPFKSAKPSQIFQQNSRNSWFAFVLTCSCSTIGLRMGWEGNATIRDQSVES